MLRVGDRVEIITDGRIGTIKGIDVGSNAVNTAGAVEVPKNCRVQFGNDNTKFELFKPEELRPVK